MNRSHVAGVALAAVAFAFAFSGPAQGRLTQGAGVAPAPRTQVLASSVPLAEGQTWVSSPIDARGYHALTLNLWTPDRANGGIRLLVRNDPSEPWAQLSSGPRSIVFSCGLDPSKPGTAHVLSDLHYAEVAFEIVFGGFGGANPPVHALNASVYLE
ncbi:MAG: hypothetical protein KDD82_06150 [Planctomycetes bacterium]|nr:hypothetical protein [Planctomycetota bacterium]